MCASLMKLSKLLCKGKEKEKKEYNSYGIAIYGVKISQLG